MDADAVAKEWLSGWFSNGAHDEMVKALGVAFRFYAASRLREAAGELDDLAAGWRGDGRTHEVVRLCTRIVAERAAAEERG